MLFATALGENVIDKSIAELLSVIVTLSMLATPFLLLADEKLAAPSKMQDRPHDDMPDEQGHVVIAGFGRFGQIVARVLRARGIPFTALDDSAEQVEFVARFGSQAYFGDASRLNILEAAKVGEAQAFVLAIDEVEGSLRTAEIVRQHFPKVPIYARARNRRHAHRLMDLGVKTIRRETFLSALDLSREVLQQIGFSEHESHRTVETFREFDRHRLYADYAHYTDEDKLREQAKRQSAELEDLFNQDAKDLDEARSDNAD